MIQRRLSQCQVVSEEHNNMIPYNKRVLDWLLCLFLPPVLLVALTPFFVTPALSDGRIHTLLV